MEYVFLGRTGLQVSRIALGLSLKNQNEAEVARRLVRQAVDIGINLIDCANVYSFVDERSNTILSEKLLGQTIKGTRDNLIITSKVGTKVGDGPNKSGVSRMHIMQEAERTLKRLDTDRIDIYFIHYPSPSESWEEQIRAMDDLICQGKVLYMGVSNHDAWQVMAALGVQNRTNSHKIVTIQNEYSLLNRGIEAQILPMADYAGLGVMVYGTLGVGLLSGRYTNGVVPNTIFWRTRKDMFAKLLKGRVGETIKEIQAMAKDYNVDPAQIAMAWVLNHSSIDVAISGADNANDLINITQALNLHLDPKDTDRLDKLSHGLRLSMDSDK